MLLLLVLGLSSCIGTDLVFDEVGASLRIDNPLDSLATGDSHQFEATYLNFVGVEEAVPVLWESSDTSIISIDLDGLAIGRTEGTATIQATAVAGEDTVHAEQEVHVGAVTVVSATERTGTLQTTSSYRLQGDFTLSEEEDGLVLSLGENYSTSDRLPGLYLYLTNNPNTTSGAYEIGEVTIFEGAHSYQLGDDVELNEYRYVLYFCKPFNVKVGDGEFNE